MTVKTPISCAHDNLARGRITQRARRLLFTFAIFVFINNVDVRAQAFKSDIDAWVAQDTIDPPPDNALLFVGSSSIRFWERLAQDFADYDIIQRGFGGSQFSDLNRYVDQIVLPYDPEAIVVFEGTNDVFSGKSADTVFRDYQSFVDLVHSGQNPARDPIPIFYIGITPTPARWGCCRTGSSEVNSLIQQHAQSDGSIYYIDTPSRFLATAPDPDRPPSAAHFLSDGLHLNQDGYDIWTEEIKPIVESVVPSPKMYRANVLHPAVGSSLLIDFGPNTSSRNLTLGTDERGHVWNNFLPENHDAVEGRVLAGRHIGNLVTTSGGNTGIGIVVTGEFAPAGGGLRDPDSLWAAIRS